MRGSDLTRQASRAGLLALLVLLAGALGLFVFVILREALMSEGRVSGQAFGAVLDDSQVRTSALNTVKVVAAVSVLSTVLGSALALLATKAGMRARGLFRVAQFVPLTIPSFVGAIGWVFLASPKAGWLNILIRKVTGGEEGPLNVQSMWGVIWVSTLYVTPFVFAMMVGALERCNSETFEAYLSNGTPAPSAVLRILTGVLRPALLGAFVLAVVETSVQFSIPLILNYDVLPYRIYELVLFESRSDHASVLAIVLLLFGGGLTLLEIAILRKRNFASLTGKGSQGATWKLGRGAGPVLKLVGALYVTCAVVLPIAALVLVSVMPYWTPAFDWSMLTLENFQTVWAAPNFRSGLRVSLILALASSLAVVVIGSVISIARASGRSGKTATVLYALANLPLGVPALVFGLGALIIFINAPLPLYGSVTAMVCVYVLHYLPIGTRSITPVVMQIGSELQESAQTAGARPGRVFVSITLPLISSGLVASGAIVFIFALREFPMSSLLATPTTKVGSVYLVDTFTNGVFPQVAVMALVFCAAGIAAVAVLQVANSRVRFRQAARVRKSSRRDPALRRPVRAARSVHDPN